MLEAEMAKTMTAHRGKYGPADGKSCTGCMACCDACPFGALSSGLDRNGFRIPVRDLSKCTGCGLCEKVCSVAAGYDFGTGAKGELIAAWNKDPVVRARSSSGGVFAAVAQVILRRGGHVYGAAIEGCEVRWRMVAAEEELPALQGSKYAHADYTGSYRAVKADLDNGIPVLFAGLSCQVAGLRLFLGAYADDPLLYTVDLVCTGVPSLLPMRQIERFGGPELSVKSYRDKEHGWSSNYQLKTVEKDRGCTTRFSPFYYRFYRIFKRHNCVRCPLAYRGRKSDLTLGDCWGDTRFPGEHRDGISAVVINSEHGKELMRQADCERHPYLWSDFLRHNPRAADAEFAAWRERSFWKKAGLFFAGLGYRLHFSPLLQKRSSRLEWFPLRCMLKLCARNDGRAVRLARSRFVEGSDS